MSPIYFESEWPRLRKHLTKIGLEYQPADEVENAVGETLVYMLRNLERLPDHGENGFQFGKYCRYIFRTFLIKRHHRQQTRVTSLPFHITLGDGTTVERPGMLKAAEQSYQRETEQRESTDVVRAVIEAITNAEDRHVMLWISQGYRQSDIARRLGVSRSMVNMRFQRARKQAEQALR